MILFGGVVANFNERNLQLIGVSDQAEKDAIVKSVMDLKRAEIEEGYTMDAVISRQVKILRVKPWLSLCSSFFPFLCQDTRVTMLKGRYSL